MATKAECVRCYKRNEKLENFKLLACGHVYCFDCLNEKQRKGGVVKCTKCRKPVDGRISALPNAISEKKSSQQMCDTCKKKPAIYLCTYEWCRRFYCQEHCKIHDKIYPNHQLINIEESVSQPKRHKKKASSSNDNPTVLLGNNRSRDVVGSELVDRSPTGVPSHQATSSIQSLKDEASRKWSVLDQLSEDASDVLKEFETETRELVKLLDSTRDKQLEEIKLKYDELKSELFKGRTRTKDEIKRFKDVDLATESAELQKVLAWLKGDRTVDPSRNSRYEEEIASVVGRQLPCLKVPAGVGLSIKDQSLLNAAIESAEGSIEIRPKSTARQDQLYTPSAAQRAINVETESQTGGIDTRQRSAARHNQLHTPSAAADVESPSWQPPREKEKFVVEEEFDKIYYEFMKIICVQDYNSRVRDKFSGVLSEQEQPDNDRFLMIKAESSVSGEARQMMDALLDLFSDITRAVHSHFIKLMYDGDKKKLADALENDLRDPSQGFIARLVTKDDIRIIGSLVNMDKDIHALESFIYEYKKKNPASSVAQKQQADITLANGTVVSIMEGDLTRMKTEAVVSSSSPDLAHQHGVSRAISMASGQRFQAAGRKLIDRKGLLREGETWVQSADGRLAYNGVRHVIHAIAPVPMKGGDVSPLLVKTVKAALEEAENLKCKTVAFPAICAGIMGVPITTCANCYCTAMDMFASQNPVSHLKQICFVVDDSEFVEDLYSAMADLSVGRKADPAGLNRYSKEVERPAVGYSGAAARFGSSITGMASGAINYVGSALTSVLSSEPAHTLSAATDDQSHVAAAASAAGTSKPNMNECPICLDQLHNPETLPCSHKFCKDCISQLIKTTKTNQCPTCRQPFRKAEGKQPKGGRMTTNKSHVPLPGYDRYGSIIINYDIPGGLQGPEHPHPGRPYQGTRRMAYLPDNSKGRKAAQLLRKAFDQRLVFTVGQSVTTGQDDCVVWNDIHHKTNERGGPSNYGYPDPDYLDRLIEDLNARGISG